MRAWVTVYENKSKLIYVCIYIYKNKMCVFYTSNTYFYSPI